MSWGRSQRRELHFGDRVVLCYADRPPDMAAMLAEAAARAPGAPALVDGDRRLDHAALQEAAARLAGGFARAGLKRGDRAVLLAGNRWEFVAILLAGLRAGVIVTPVSVRSRGPELAYILQDTGAAALLHDGALAGTVADAAPAASVRVIDIDGAAFGAMAAAAPAPPAEIGEDDVAVILYTSGTTGRPKGAMLTHLNLVHSCLHFIHGMALTPGDRSLMAVPASHVTGLVANILALLAAGAAVLILREFRVEEFLALAERERMTHTLMVPAMYNLVLMRADLGAADLSAWRIGGFGGGPMPEATIAKLAAALPNLALVNAYGATETTSPATMTPAGVADRPDSVGRALPCADIRVMDEAGREAPPGTPGELWIAGPMVVPGYWRNAEKTAESFVHGYWRSGDVGLVDEAGFIRVFDRLKDMINRGGYKIFSAEVENVLAAHPDVAEAAILPSPDPVLGERVRAVVVTAAGRRADEAALAAYCAARLSDYKCPDIWEFRDEPLPRNANGKIQKRDLM